MELKSRNLKDRKKKKNKKRDRRNTSQSIILSKDDMDKLEEQRMKKIKPIKKDSFDGLIK